MPRKTCFKFKIDFPFLQFGCLAWPGSTAVCCLNIFGTKQGWKDTNRIYIFTTRRSAAPHSPAQAGQTFTIILGDKASRGLPRLDSTFHQIFSGSTRKGRQTRDSFAGISSNSSFMERIICISPSSAPCGSGNNVQRRWRLNNEWGEDPK